MISNIEDTGGDGGGFVHRLGSFFGVGGGEAEPTVTYGDRLGHYPGPDEIAAGRAADIGYGTGNEAYIEGRTQNAFSNPPTRPGGPREIVGIPDGGLTTATVTNPRFGGGAPGTKETSDLYTAAQLAVQRSPISALGYDPRRVSLDTKSGDKMSIAGAYSPKQDNAYSNATYSSNIIHESTHRGLERLRQAGVVPQDLWDRLPEEEHIVRYIMALHMGDPENGRGAMSDEQRASALRFFGRKPDNPQEYDPTASSLAKKHRAALNELTGIAATYFASLHPGGPR